MLKIHTLRVNQMSQPQYVCLEVRFSWILESSRRNCRQVSYQLRIFRKDDLVWDSGEICSDRNSYIPYTGPELLPLQYYIWQVTCTDCFGEKAQGSDTFCTCRGNGPWHTNWVQPVQQETVKERPYPFGQQQISGPRDYHEFQPTQLIRRKIEIPKEIKSAFLHASAHGIYRVEVNGEKLDSYLFAPECSPYDKLIMFQTYDLTEKLRVGENVIGFELADGWWSGRLGLGSWSCCYGNKKELFMECEVTYQDGTQVYFGGEGAKSTAGATVYADLFVGEKFNASALPQDWSCSGYDDSKWLYVQPLQLPLDHLQPQIGEGVKIIREFKPLAVLKTPDEDLVLDVGQNIAGFLRFSVECEEGHEIVLEYSEMLREDGRFFQNIMGVNKDQKDVYITKSGKQTWNPQFTYHGFRYVRISGWPGVLLKDFFSVCVISTDMEDIGDFSCSDSGLNQLQKNIKQSQTANTISIPTDCPQREKAGWTGDLAVYAPTMLYLSSAEVFLRRWMLYLRKEQFPNGLVPSVIPYWEVCREISEILGSHTSCGWGDAVVLVPWAIYLETGNPSVLKENYEAMCLWIQYVQSEAENHFPENYETFDDRKKDRQKYLWNTGFHFGDWLMPGIIMAGGKPRDTAYATKELFASAYYAHSVKIISQAADVLNLPGDAELYRKLYEKIREAFIEEYLDGEGRVELEFQGSYVLCLKFGLVTEKLRPMVLNHLCRMIEENGYRLDTGFLSIPFLLDVLCENGRKDIAFKLLFQRKCPGWLYMVEHGATTIWESWNCISEDGTVGAYSYNHYAFGCIGAWMYREIAGLRLLEAGYRKMQITPGIESGLSWASTEHRTPYGRVAVEWKRQGGKFQMNVTIPTGTSAEIFLPDDTVEIKGSGKYQFQCTVDEFL